CIQQMISRAAVIMLGSWILVVFCVCLLLLFIRIQRPKNFPPGPRPIPIFGNLFHFNIKNPLKDFVKFAEQYGSIYSLYIGTKPAVILTGLKAIREALVNKAADFSGRPDNLIKDVTEGKGAMIRAYQEQRVALQTANKWLQQPKPTHVTPPTAAALPHSELVCMALPEKFHGSADCCHGVLRQCDNFFAHQRGLYREETTKCAFLLSLLMRRALDWASTVWDSDPQCNSLSGWNDAALLAVFYKGLRLALQAEMACRDTNTTLSNYMTKAIRMDNLLHQQCPGARPYTELWFQEEYQRSREEGPEPIQQRWAPLQWKEHRRFALMTLRNFGLGKQSMENRILGEIEHLVAKLDKYAGSSLYPETLFHDAASNIIYLVLFGIRYNYGDEILKVYVRLYTENAKLANGTWAMIYDAFPIVRSLPLPFKKAFENYKTLKTLTLKMINKHRAKRVPGKPRDFVDCYLDELDKRDSRSTFSEYQLIVYIMNLHIAGTDTTSNTLLTAILYLMAHPDIQKKCQQEIDEVIGNKPQPSFEDRHNMPYTQAMIHETQRIANTVPLSVFHCTTRDTDLMGYSIPKGTMIIPNLSSVLSEEGQWKFPHEFNPSNFLNEQGQFEKPEAFIPFSA
ncbi:hypothetical protein QTP86_024522, partial [Hemibagrus guttatus]